MSSALDVLCGLLDDSSDEEGYKAQGEAGNDSKVNVPPAAEKTQDEIHAIKEDDYCAGLDQHEEEEEEDEASAMEAELKAMQEKMQRMKEAIQAKKKAKKESGGGKSTATASTSSSASATAPVSEVDLFSAPSSSRAGAPRFPVRTDPFKECQQGKLRAKTHLPTPQYGPALPGKSSRVLQGGDKERLLEDILMRDKEKRDAELVRGDLDLDSSDEEEARNPTQQKYNEYGKELKKKLESSSRAPSDLKGQITSFGASSKGKKVGFNQVEGCTLNLTSADRNKLLPKEVMLEKFSRLKVSRPAVSAASIEAHMLGKTFVPMSRMREAVLRRETDSGDWTTIGVVYHKNSQTSKNGNAYTMWRMTDLQGDISTVTVMLFGRCHASHYKVPTNRVVGILNPKIMDDRTGKGEVTLSVDHPDKILEIGDSLEVGKCQAKRKDGSGCTNLVNRGTCEYCAYHVKKAYQSMSSKRTDLQSTFSGTAGVRSRIMGKIDPKGNYFAGGQSLNASVGGSVTVGGGSGGLGGGGQSGFGSRPPFAGSQKHRSKDNRALAALGVEKVNHALEAEERQKAALAVLQRKGKAMFKSHLSQAERQTVKAVAKDVSADLGMRLLAPTPGARGLLKTLSKEDKSTSENQDGEKLQKDANSKADEVKSAKQLLFDHKKQLAEERAKKVLFERQQKSSLSAGPQLGRGFGGGGMIDLNSPSSNRGSVARAKALMALKGKTLESKDPNHVPSRKRKAEELEVAKKKVALALDKKERRESVENKESEAGEKDKVHVTSTGQVMSKERLAAICGAKSKNEHLADEYGNEVMEKRFDLLEKKEAMEEKMAGTMELETKAVSCRECNYTSYAQSELCRERGHRIKRITATKKFFECKDCKKRTVSLDKYPKTACTKCGGSSWARTGMMRERKGPVLDSERLLIRGVEQKFIGQTVSSEDLQL